MCLAANDSGDSTSTRTMPRELSAPMSSSRVIVETLTAAGKIGFTVPSSHGARIARTTAAMLFKLTLATLVALALVGAIDAPASAQYFRRNKVQYRKLDFQVLKTEH